MTNLPPSTLPKAAGILLTQQLRHYFIASHFSEAFPWLVTPSEDAGSTRSLSDANEIHGHVTPESTELELASSCMERAGGDRDRH